MYEKSENEISESGKGSVTAAAGRPVRRDQADDQRY